MPLVISIQLALTSILSPFRFAIGLNSIGRASLTIDAGSKDFKTFFIAISP
jgi:hypothetical protein